MKNLISELYKEILNTDNRYDYKIINEPTHIFNTLELNITFGKLVELSEKYNSLSITQSVVINPDNPLLKITEMERDRSYDNLLLDYFNGKWTHLGYPSIIREAINGERFYNKLEQIQTLDNCNDIILTIQFISIQAKIYFFNNRMEFYNYLLNSDKLISHINNSLALHCLISNHKPLPIIFLKDENLFIGGNIDANKENFFEQQIHNNLYLFAKSKASYIYNKLNNENSFINELKGIKSGSTI